MIEKIVWWIQYMINFLFMLYIFRYISNAFYSTPGSFLIDLFLIVVSIILAYLLTIRFKNNS
ncbi:hypothetical protein EWH91_12015 [Sporolactobacillus sp. THM19-2]|nr:hypothetical protein EWH91_12015 [Sporolactobacillus sp. THM19-2]